jgi:hypothetical protein
VQRGRDAHLFIGEASALYFPAAEEKDQFVECDRFCEGWEFGEKATIINVEPRLAPMSILTLDSGREFGAIDECTSTFVSFIS